MNLPKPLNDLVENLKRLPGIGNKTALRLALFILNDLEKEEAASLSEALISVKENLSFCEICGVIKEDACPICQDNKRDQSTIMVVETIKDLLVFENTNNYFGLYHILGGTIDFSKGIEPDDLKIDSLIKRANSNKEIILALNGAVDGQLTSNYIEELLKDKDVTLSKIAYGLPVGADLSFADDKTLKVALQNRMKVK
ncbi:MAG TPA: recombination protein RecR [Acholeplasma sp.]|jgi:recombination protein RecR|nr:recombination mediator RecR [Acholeplasmatales bacterium]HHV33074.1 recombination protein RecR [Acholeplasma sp.]